MLKINLLPIRQLKKRAAAVNQLIIAGIAVFGLILFLIVAGTIQAFVADGIRDDITELNQIKKKHAPILAEITKFEKKKKELERRIDVITELKKNSTLAIRVMDEVANRIDNDRLWLLSFQNRGGLLSLTGVALDNRSIADFMKALEDSPYINKESVNLDNSTLKRIAGKNLKSFALSCNVSPPATETTEPKKQKK